MADDLVTPWIPVSARLPIRYEPVLVVVPLGSGRLVVPNSLMECMDGTWRLYGMDHPYQFGDEITHWMPLPEPPK